VHQACASTWSNTGIVFYIHQIHWHNVETHKSKRKSSSKMTGPWMSVTTLNFVSSSFFVLPNVDKELKNPVTLSDVGLPLTGPGTPPPLDPSEAAKGYLRKGEEVKEGRGGGVMTGASVKFIKRP
jgi:hypothetical protein